MKLLMILLWKGTSDPVAPYFKGQRRNAPAMHPTSLCISTRTVFTRCCRLQCVTEMNINYYQRSPETEQFMTAEISGNALKPGP